LNVPSIAPVSRETPRQVRITHPFHPLYGKQFCVVEVRCVFAESYLYFHDETGRLREIPAAWTDFADGDAFVEVAAGRSALHGRSLLELVELVEHFARKGGNEA
jgi:hypothetical protein